MSLPNIVQRAFLACMLIAYVANASAVALTKENIEKALNDAYQEYRGLKEGANADYIPALAKVDSRIFGITLVTLDGEVYTAGDIKSEVSIQSISKVLSMAMVMDESGPEALYNNIGVDATGQAFNSIVAIELSRGAEMNPLVNAGAITTTSLIKGENYQEIWDKIIKKYSEFAGRDLRVLDDIYKSEAATNQRNRAIASLMAAYGHIKTDPLQATDI